MFRHDSNPTVGTDTKPADASHEVRPEIVDELQILDLMKGVRGTDDLALFGLTPTKEERRRRKSRLI